MYSRNASTTLPSNSGFTSMRRTPKSHMRHMRSQLRVEADKAEHARSLDALNQGEWVVKGKRYNKIHCESTDADRIDHKLQDMESIKKTIHNSMSLIRPRKHKHNTETLCDKKNITEDKKKTTKDKKNTTKDKKRHKKKPVTSINNSFSILSLDSTDDESESAHEFPSLSMADFNEETKLIGPEDFPSPPTTTRKTKNSISFSDAVKSVPSLPVMTQKPPVEIIRPVPLAATKKRVSWGTIQHYQDESEDEDEEDDYFEIDFKPGDSWAKFV